MGGLTLRDKVIEALQAAGATEEMVAAAVGVFGEFGEFPRRPNGRPRKHADRAAKDRAYRARKRAHDETQNETHPPRDVWPEGRDETHDETPVPDALNLRARLFAASSGNVHALADISPIRALLDQGCDLEADILPIVARELPELPRPLRNWGAPWLVRDILAARDQRLAGHRVEAPSPPRHAPPAIDWDEFVGGYRAGLIKWNTARLGPKPDELGCRAPPEVLREHGY